ncbi:MAG: hypothetical protein IJ697_01020 [Synergistaceae bacterium]|nr:hypothetical protein [Synergistaceae bacterium]
MNLTFPELQIDYRSSPQRIRVLTETWFKNEVYCPACGNYNLLKFPNNSKLADFYCGRCGEVFELKSKGKPIGKTILDGAYYAALERINSSTNPNLFVLHYNQNFVENLTLVPKHFFTPDTLVIRKALSSHARRAGYIGSVINYGGIPSAGKIAVIEAHREIFKDSVMKNYAHAVSLRVRNMDLRGWLMDVMKCIDNIPHEFFSLGELYRLKDELGVKHPSNHNVKAKIRQQLQFLRDKGFIEFLGRGKYRKILLG